MFAFTNTQYTTTLKLDALDEYVFNAWNTFFGERDPDTHYYYNLWAAPFMLNLSRELKTLVVPGYVFTCHYNKNLCRLIKQDGGNVVAEVNLTHNYVTLKNGFTADDFRKLVERMIEVLSSIALAALNMFKDGRSLSERHMNDVARELLDTLMNNYYVLPTIDEQVYRLAEEFMSYPNSLYYKVKLKPGQAKRWRSAAYRVRRADLKVKSRQVTLHYDDYGLGKVKVVVTARFKWVSALVTISLVDRGKTHTIYAIVFPDYMRKGDEWKLNVYFTPRSISSTRESFELFKTFRYRVLDLLRDGFRALRNKLATRADTSNYELEYIDAWLDILENPAQLYTEYFFTS
ncbi:MAG: hypothetical protein QXD83_04090 [Sulfolobales archaeon]